MHQPQYHLLLLGGTGLCGLIFTRLALDAGHTLTLYVRTPSKIPADLASNPNLHIIQGELGDAEGLKKAAACGAKLFISFAGPTLGEKQRTPITQALKTLYPHLLAASYTRILILSAPSYPAPEDTRSIKWWVVTNVYVRVFWGDSFEEIHGLSQATVDLGESIKWTVFRVPLLSGEEAGEGGDVEACFVGDKKGRDGLWLDRGRLARWVLGELEEEKWVGLLPLVSNA